MGSRGPFLWGQDTYAENKSVWGHNLHLDQSIGTPDVQYLQYEDMMHAHSWGRDVCIEDQTYGDVQRTHLYGDTIYIYAQSINVLGHQMYLQYEDIMHAQRTNPMSRCMYR